MGYSQPGVTAYATATKEMVTGPCTLYAVGILAGADAATVVFRDGGLAGPIVWALGAGIGLSDGMPFPSCIRVKQSLYAVITGTTPIVTANIELPASSQA